MKDKSYDKSDIKCRHLIMQRKFILNDRILFIPAENKLCSLGVRGPEVTLNGPVCRFLVLLLENCDQVVHQEVILREVWGKNGQFVTQNTLYQNVSLLRKGLKKAGLITATIKTHPKVGFSFRGFVQIIDEVENGEITESVKGESPSVVSVDVADKLPAALSTDLDSESLPSSLSMKKHKFYNQIHIFYLGVILLSTISMLTFFSIENMKNNKFNADHDIIAQVNHCPLYVDRGNRKVDFSRIIGYLIEQGVTCGDGQFTYLTKSIYRDDLLLFTCTPMEDEELVCRTRHKLPPYLYPK